MTYCLKITLSPQRAGEITLAVYNATSFSVDYEAKVDDVQAGVDISITSPNVAFRALLPGWKKSGKGAFFLSGGGYANNGAWSVGLGHQFGSPVKSYFKNFAEAGLATFSKEGIHVCCFTICDLVFGGDNIVGEPGKYGKETGAAAAFRKKLTSTVVATAEATQEKWVPEVVIAPDK